MMDVICDCLLIADALAAGDGLEGFGSRCSIIDCSLLINCVSMYVSAGKCNLRVVV
jgi:hypothetical protein